MDTNFFINPQGNSKNYLIKKAGQQTSYMAARNNGLQQDTVNFTGKHKQIGGKGGWKQSLFALLGLTTIATPMVANLTGCSSGEASNAQETQQPAPEQPKTDELTVPEDYRAEIPVITEDYTSVQNLYLNDDVKFNAVTFAPSNLPKGVIQTIVSPEKDDENNLLTGSTLFILFD